jgi:protein gp37
MPAHGAAAWTRGNGMAKTTGIAWTRSTRNLWAGCTKVGPGCDGCYAEAFQRWVQGKDPESGEAKNWGPGRPRIPYLEGAFKDLRSWNRRRRSSGAAPARMWPRAIGFWPVFLNTQSDFFDNEAPQEWRELAYPVIEECSNLTLFSSPSASATSRRWCRRTGCATASRDHVRLLITVVNQAEAERDIPKLLALPCKNGISYEPALELIDFRACRRNLNERSWPASPRTRDSMPCIRDLRPPHRMDHRGRRIRPGRPQGAAVRHRMGARHDRRRAATPACRSSSSSSAASASATPTISATPGSRRYADDLRRTRRPRALQVQRRHRRGSGGMAGGSSRQGVAAMTYQAKVDLFILHCFGRKVAEDVAERNHRFLEESLELVQAKGCTAAEAHMLVDYVFGRPVGDPHQEAGGVMVTLSALCSAAGLDMEEAGYDELARVWTKIDAIREKQKNKPRNSPLPEAPQ